MQTCYYNNMPYEAYIYDYLTDATWVGNALAGLTVLSALRPGRVWLDVEDTTSASVKTRAEKVSGDLASISQGGFERGIYTGKWFWTGYMNNTTAFASEPLWDSNYDGVTNTAVDFHPYGGWTFCTYKQYAGTQPNNTDPDVTSGPS